jgi:hypothetical protein
MVKLQHCLKGAALMLVLTLLAFAQTTPAKLSVIIGEHKIKFTPLGQSQELRLEVQNHVGELIYDSGALAEADLNWNLQTGNGQPLEPGLYAYTLSIKAPDAEAPQKHQGHLIIEKGGDRLWLTTKGDGAAGAEVAGDELVVARDSERTTAGAGSVAAGRTLAERGAQGRQLADEKNGATQENTQSLLNLSGTGATNRITKWLDGPQGVLGDSTITETANGNVGIGTTAPDTKFEVEGGDVQIEKSGSPSLFLFSRGGGTQRYSLRATNDLDRAGGRNFIIRNESQGSDELTITPFGNVGIGTGNPREKLQVNGNIVATGNVTAQGVSFQQLLQRIQRLEQKVGGGTTSPGGGTISPERRIIVSKEGAGSTSVFTVTGTGFTPNKRVVVKITAPNFTQVQFPETAGADGKFVSRHGVNCMSGLQLTFTAFEDANPSNTQAMPIVTTCP